MRRLLLTSLLAFASYSCFAQGVDPGRATLVATTTSIGKKIINEEASETSIQAGEHVIYHEKVKKIVNLQKQFDEYLSNFKEVLTCAAELYGLFYEVQNAIDGLNYFKKVSLKVAQHQTTNLVAFYYSNRGRYLYNDIVNTGLQVCADIEKVLPIGKKSKLTKWERIECIGRIRKNVNKINRSIWKVANMLKYTTLLDTWYEITQSTKPVKQTRPMSVIAEEARKSWIRHAQGANQYNSKN